MKKVWKGLKKLIRGILMVIWTPFVLIWKGLVLIWRGLVAVVVGIWRVFVAIWRLFVAIWRGIAKAWRAFVTFFKPKYRVNATTYFVIPGMPLNRTKNHHEFGKGEYTKAKEFFDKIVKKTREVKFSPVEIVLIKGKKKVVESKTFGPVEQLLKLKMAG